MEILRRRHGEMETWRYEYMETLIWRHGIKIMGNSEVLQRIKGIPEAQAIFFNPFADCSSCKQKCY
jgi:hypothetical protein